MSDLDLELQIQRCVDGQLPEADQQILLRRLEASKDGWRRLSLAYVENQCWCQTIQKATPRPVAAALPTPRRRTAPAMWVKVAASMAAGVMGAVVLQQQFVRGPGGTTSQGLIATTPEAPASSDVVKPSPSPKPRSSPPSGAPIQMASDRLIPDHIRQDLQRSGYTVDEGQAYYAYPLEDGSQYIVPVNTARVRVGVQ
jgi:hypothetical protein